MVSSKLWQGYSSNTTDDDAIAEFVKRYGRKPGGIRRSNGAVLAGPISQSEHDAKGQSKHE